MQLSCYHYVQRQIPCITGLKYLSLFFLYLLCRRYYIMWEVSKTSQLTVTSAPTSSFLAVEPVALLYEDDLAEVSVKQVDSLSLWHWSWLPPFWQLSQWYYFVRMILLRFQWNEWSFSDLHSFHHQNVTKVSVTHWNLHFTTIIGLAYGHKICIVLYDLFKCLSSAPFLCLANVRELAGGVSGEISGRFVAYSGWPVPDPTCHSCNIQEIYLNV
jgi:hypothetical protein